MPAPRTPGGDSEAVEVVVMPEHIDDIAIVPDETLIGVSELVLPDLGKVPAVVVQLLEAGETMAVITWAVADARSVALAILEAVAGTTPQPAQPTRVMLRMGGANRNLALGGKALVTAMFGPVGDELVRHVVDDHGVSAAVAWSVPIEQVRTLHETFPHQQGDH